MSRETLERAGKILTVLMLTLGAMLLVSLAREGWRLLFSPQQYAAWSAPRWTGLLVYLLGYGAALLLCAAGKLWVFLVLKRKR